MKKCTKLWLCNDGTKIRVCDMTDSHLLNCIRLIKRKCEVVLSSELHAAYSVLNGLQGEMAIDSCESSIRSMEEDDALDMVLPEIYHDMYSEALRRDLEKTNDF